MKSGKYYIFSFLMLIIVSLLIEPFPNSILANYKINNESSYIKLNGTSTLHEWGADAKKINGALTTEIVNQKIEKISLLEIYVTANSIKSGKSGLDKNMHEALKAKAFPIISFTLKDHVFDQSSLKLTGDLRIAGVTKSLKTKIDSEVTENEIKLSGNFEVKMSDFNIEPPKLALGSLKVDDPVNINFLLVFSRNVP